MKTLRTTLAALLLSLSLAAVGADVELDTDEKQYSYAMGVIFAQNVSAQLDELDVDAFFMALDDVLRGNTVRLDQEEIQSIMATQQEKRQSSAVDNHKEGQVFLEKNGKKDGVVTTASGLQYTVLTAGKGAKPGPDDTVLAHYRGTLIDGTEFDSSHARGEPMEFGVTQVIAGWQEALQLMPQGSKWRVFVPSDLAYGASGAGAKIGPHAALIFDIELLDIK